jgi:hypothetical protein
MSPEGEHIDSSPRFSVLRAALVLAAFVVAVAVLVAIGTRPSVSGVPSPTTTPTTVAAGVTTTTAPAGAAARGATTTTTTTAPSTTTTAHGTRHHTGASSTTTTTVPHSSVSVVVANGTTTSGLAAHFSSIIGGSGWNMKTPTNASSPQTTSAVYYATGMQPAAAAIASAIGVKPNQVLPMSSSVPVNAVTGTDVVVVIGQDLAAAGGS